MSAPQPKSSTDPLRSFLFRIIYFFFAGASMASGASADLVPLSTSDGICTQTTVAGQLVWQNTGNSSFLYFRRPNSFSFNAGQTLYVRATYLDVGDGRIGLQYDGQAGAFTQPVVHTRTSRVGSGKFVNGYFELPAVLFARRENGSTDFRLICGQPGGIPFSVQKITLQDTPFTDPDFQLAVSRPWKTRYTGTAKDYADTTTLKDKVMVGYQGWFRTPNDLDDNGWVHWASNNSMSPANFNTDMWPELTQYDPASLFRAGNVTTRNGQPAHLFSSTSLSAVRTHFRWMRKHDIDGAFVQRFGPQAGAQPEWVLRNISQAAAEEGITWAIEYDVSGMADSTVVAKLQADWEWLTGEFGLLQDPRYAHEGTKPVVFIWGFPFADRGFTTPNANAAVDYFLSQGAYVIGGIPNIWRTLDADWQAHILKYNGVLVWQNQSASDGPAFRNRGQDFYPHIWPGFSWANLQKQPATPPADYTDREGGQHYWNGGKKWIDGGADRLFVGMFDEYDEGTAIMPMSDDPPNPSAEYGRFLDNQGKPSDWWMSLTSELKRMMLKQRTNTSVLPTVASLENRSNIGSEATIDLDSTNDSTGLSQIDVGDGNTVVETVGGKESRTNSNPAADLYMYFNVADNFAHQLPNGDVTVEVEYFDAAGGTMLALQYDATGAAYQGHPQTITTIGSNRWRRVRFEIADALFAGRQNNGSDFRLTFGGKKLNVNRVWVRLPEENLYPFTWTNTLAGTTLSWSLGQNWLGGVIAPSSPLSSAEFFTGETFPGGNVTISNNSSGTRHIGKIRLSGEASSTDATAIQLSGSPLSFGGVSPGIQLDATKHAALSYDIATPLIVTAPTMISGTGDAEFKISGAISGTGGLVKTGGSTLNLNGTASFLGATTVNDGTLAIAGSLAGSSFTLAQGATLSGSGTISAPATIHGLHRPDRAQFSGPLTYAADSKIEWSLSENTANPGTNYPEISSTTTEAVTGATVNIVLNGGGSTVNFNDPIWDSSCSWNILEASAALTGNLTLGSITPDSAGQAASGYGTFSLSHTSNALKLIWTPRVDFLGWQMSRFGMNAADPEVSGNNADPDHDGVSNLLEYALGMDPNVSDAGGLPKAEVSANYLTFTYSIPSGQEDLAYQVEWSEDLLVWSSDGVSEKIAFENGAVRSIKAEIPLGEKQRFARLRVIRDQ